MSEGRYRDEPMDAVDQINDLKRRLESLEQNPNVGGAFSPAGAISAFAGPAANVPSGYLVCNGAAVSRVTFARLFAAIGTTWGAGDGSATFNLPDLIDKWLVGAGNLYALASTVGSTTHTHTISATHTHTNPDTSTTGDHAHTSSGTDSGGSHTHGIPQGTDQTSGVGGTAVFTVSHQSHTHGGTNSGGSHSHGVSGNTGTTGNHAHTQGATGAASPGTSDSGSSLPLSKAVTPIIRF